MRLKLKQEIRIDKYMYNEQFMNRILNLYLGRALFVVRRAFIFSSLKTWPNLVKLSFIFADMYHYTAHLLLLHYGVIMQLSSAIVYFYLFYKEASWYADRYEPPDNSLWYSGDR